jgi:hypothetical protein
MTDDFWDGFAGRNDAATFQRHPTSGAPYVNHPTKRTLKGLPSRVQYGRPSSAYAQIDQRFNLEKWSQREVLVGAITMLMTGEILPDDLGIISEFNRDDADHKKALDRLCVMAKERSGSMIAAEHGTHHHLTTEDGDNEVDIIGRLRAGERLGVSAAVTEAVLRAWDRLINEYDLEILSVEQPVVDDDFNLAGTLDRVARLGRDLTFQTDDGPVTIPAGTVIVLDLKTGKLSVDRNDLPKYWHGYAVQVASYAKSRPYDVKTEERTRWERRPSRKHALIAHLLVADDRVEARLIYVNLTAGISALQIIKRAKAYAKRNDVFSHAGPALVTEPVTS